MNAFKKSVRQLNTVKSIVFYAICVSLCLSACVLLFHLNVTYSVALEQEIRCGIEEHTHTDACYDGDYLVCEKQPHTHDGNCYIVLLKDNNINGILTLLGDNENHSLEYVINDTMSSALNFNSNINGNEDTEQTDTSGLTQDTVIQLNNTISDKDELPDIVLNENINNAQTLSASGEQNNGQNNDTNQNDQSTQQSNNTSTFDIGDDASSSNYSANFYIYLDGKWTCIGTLQYSLTANSNRYDYTIPTSSVLNLVNSALGTNYAYNSFDISVSTSESSGYTTSNVGIGSVTTTIAHRQRSSAAKSARYIHIIPNNASASSTAFAFYTVTIDENVLQRGIGHIPETHLPVGGKNTHCVLAGHTGLPSAKLLTNIDHLKVGDRFYIHVLNEVLEYKIDDVSVVEPYEVSRLNVISGKDCVTLVTCTPYGVNSHRLLVRGVRVDEADLSAKQDGVVNELLNIDMKYLLTFSLTGLFIIIVAVKKLRDIKKNKKLAKEKGGEKTDEKNT